MPHPPTAEQAHAIELFVTGSDLVVEAGAGTGKTSTLVSMALACPERRGQYVAFNKSIVVEAESKMPGNVACNTAHSLAFRAVGRQFSHRLRQGRMRSDQLAGLMGIDALVVPAPGGPKRLAPEWMAGLVMRAVTNFCQSGSLAIQVSHFPYVDGLDAHTDDGRRTYENNNRLADHLIGAATEAWKDLMDPRGRLPYKHEHYLKAWQLSDPYINADFILFDEAQDASPVMLAIVDAQQHAQRVFVGDSNQAIYEFTGAVNALAKTGIENTAHLTQSFRFGPAIAEQANVALAKLSASLRLTGFDAIESSVGPISKPDCYLARTNASVIVRLFAELEQGGKPHLIGGGREITDFARAAQALMAGRRTTHPELACFGSWPEVQAYCRNDEQGEELRLMVNTVDAHGPARIIQALERMPSEDRATIVLSTAHKAKGREWQTVELGADFPDPFGENKRPITPSEYRLQYVAVTRAQLRVDVSAVPLFAGTKAPTPTPAA